MALADPGSPPKGGSGRRPMTCPPMPAITAHTAAAADPGEAVDVRSESLDRLRALKIKLQGEIMHAEKEKQKTLQDEPLVPLSLVEEYKDHRNRRGGKAAQQAGQAENRKAAQQKGSGKQRELDICRESNEKDLLNLRHHNQRLKSLIDLRQQSSKRMEERFENEIARLKIKLDKTMTDKFDPKSSMKNLREINTLIQGKVSHLQRTIEMQAEIEKMNLVRQYRVKMHELKKELAEEKHSNYTGAQEWIDKNEALNTELNEAGRTLEAINTSNLKLAQENKELKIRYKQQEDERLAIVKRVTALRREQGRLKEQVDILEKECCDVAQHMPDDAKAAQDVDALAKPRHESVQTEAKYLEMINRLKRQLEHERRSLKQVRSSHISLLQERTELEVFLRQCLQDVRAEIAATSHSYPANLTRDSCNVPDYSAEHRDHLLELLLSKERVLSVLYSKTFPYKKPEEALTSEIDPNATHDHLMSSSAEIDMDTLWKKWKSWTERSI